MSAKNMDETIAGDTEIDYCNCGEIVFHGHYISEDDVIENNPQVMNQIRSNFQTIVVSEPNGIIIKRLSNVSIVQPHSNMFEIVCQKCKIGFRLILGRDLCYSCRIEECLIQPNSSKTSILKRPMSSFFPINLRRFVKEQTPDPTAAFIQQAKSVCSPTLPMANCLPEMDDDADFDMMFSSKQQCIVGSFTDQWILSPEFSYDQN